MADSDLLRKIAENFTELAERERRVFKDLTGVEMLKLPTLGEVGRAFEATRQKLREFEERARRTPPPQGDSPES
jgi:DNA-directed RNA polymerase sigma subunit (sigma70/sigma32)